MRDVEDVWDLPIKRMDIKEFREIGLLQEVNRLFFHPLGLALEVSVDEDENESISGLWDYRQDENGIIYSNGILSKEKADRVKALRKSAARKKKYGYIVQRIR